MTWWRESLDRLRREQGRGREPLRPVLRLPVPDLAPPPSCPSLDGPVEGPRVIIIDLWGDDPEDI